MSSELVSICIFISGLAISFFIWVISIRKDVDLNKQRMDNHIEGFATFKSEIKKDFDDIISSNRETQKLLNQIIIEIQVANNQSKNDGKEHRELKKKVEDLENKFNHMRAGFEKIISSKEYINLKSL